MPGSIVIIDDEKDVSESLQEALCDAGYPAIAAPTVQAGLELVAKQDVDVVLTDLGMAEMSGLVVCERVMGVRPDIPVVVITGQNDVDSAVASLRAGAFDFITKPVDSKLLDAHRRSRGRPPAHARRAASGCGRSSGRASTSPATSAASPQMRKVSDLVARVATSEAAVLIHGETGTGKELVARALHHASDRRKGPVRGHQLRRRAADAARERAVRPRARRLHRREGRPHGAVRAGRRRHAVPRRDRRAAARDAAQAAARAAGAQGAARRRRTPRSPFDARLVDRDQPRPRGRGRRASASAKTSSTASTS